MPTLVLPDYMGDLRGWLRTQPDLAPLHAGRVFFAIPATPVFPLIRMLDVNTVAQPGEAPMFDHRSSLIVWGGKPSDYAAVSLLAQTLGSVLQHTPTPFAIGGTWIGNIGGVSVRDSPDPDTGAPRRIVDSLITLRAA